MGLWLSTPRVVLACSLSADVSEGLDPDLACSFPWASGISPMVGCV